LKRCTACIPKKKKRRRRTGFRKLILEKGKSAYLDREHFLALAEVCLLGRPVKTNRKKRNRFDRNRARGRKRGEKSRVFALVRKELTGIDTQGYTCAGSLTKKKRRCSREQHPAKKGKKRRRRFSARSTEEEDDTVLPGGEREGGGSQDRTLVAIYCT